MDDLGQQQGDNVIDAVRLVNVDVAEGDLFGHSLLADADLGGSRDDFEFVGQEALLDGLGRGEIRG